MFAPLRRRLGARLSPRSFDLLHLLIWFFATRLLILGVGHLAHAHADPSRLASQAGPDLRVGASAPALLEPFARWDGYFYVSLSREGYPAARESPVFHAAFFPLYPLVVRAADAVVGDTWAAAVLVSNLAALLAVAVMASVVRGAAGRRAARAAVVLILVSPGSHFLSMPYTEALFGLLIALGLKALQDDRLLLAGVVGALATATRSTGVALTAAIGVELWLARDWARRGRAALAGLLSVTGLVAFVAFNVRQYGDALYFSRLQSLWARSPGPFAPILAFLRFDRDPDYYLVSLAAIAGVVYAFRRVPRAWWTTSALLVAIPLWTGTLRSMVRYAGTNLPLLASLAVLLKPRAFRLVAAGSFALMIYEVVRICAGFANN